MDELGSTRSGEALEVPDQLRTLFNRPDEVRVLVMPCYLPGLKSIGLRFGAGSRTERRDWDTSHPNDLGV